MIISKARSKKSKKKVAHQSSSSSSDSSDEDKKPILKKGADAKKNDKKYQFEIIIGKQSLCSFNKWNLRKQIRNH